MGVSEEGEGMREKGRVEEKRGRERRGRGIGLMKSRKAPFSAPRC